MDDPLDMHGAVGAVVVLRRNGKDGGRFLLFNKEASIGR